MNTIHITQTLLMACTLALLSSSAMAKNETANHHAETLLKLAVDTQLANAQTQAATAQLNAKNAQQKLTTPKRAQNAVERTTQSLQTSRTARSPIDNILLKSLVTTGGTTTAWISLEGELIEVRKGSQIGGITVIELNENSILFNDGRKQKRRWMSGYQTNTTATATPTSRSR